MIKENIYLSTLYSVHQSLLYPILPFQIYHGDLQVSQDVVGHFISFHLISFDFKIVQYFCQNQSQNDKTHVSIKVMSSEPQGGLATTEAEYIPHKKWLDVLEVALLLFYCDKLAMKQRIIRCGVCYHPFEDASLMSPSSRLSSRAA